MKKYLLVLCSICLLFMVSGCAGLHDATFSGSKAGNEYYFDIMFDILNTTFSHELVMKKGANIHMCIEKTSGDITVKILNNQSIPVYEGNGDVTTDLLVAIENDGTYTVSVTGKKAKGRVTFTRE